MLPVHLLILPQCHVYIEVVPDVEGYREVMQRYREERHVLFHPPGLQHWQIKGWSEIPKHRQLEQSSPVTIFEGVATVATNHHGSYGCVAGLAHELL